MIRRAAWRAVGLTELPAAQRKRSRLHGRAAPFRGRTAPEAEGVVTARGEPGAQVGGRSTRRGACGARPPAAGPRDGRRRLGARRRGRCTRGARRAAPSPADGSRGLGRPARNFPRRPPATRSRRGWRAPGRPGGRRPRRPRPRPRGHPISRASQKRHLPPQCAFGRLGYA